MTISTQSTSSLSALQQKNIIHLHAEHLFANQQIAKMYQTNEETIELLAKNAQAAGFYPSN